MIKLEQNAIVADTLDDLGDQDADYTNAQHQASLDALDDLGGDSTIDLTIVVPASGKPA